MTTPGETHDDRCCMNGVPAGSDPSPACPGIDALMEEWGETIGCRHCRMCASCDAGLPMSCTCGPCTCSGDCEHPRCAQGPGEPGAMVGLVIDEAAEIFSKVWPCGPRPDLAEQVMRLGRKTDVTICPEEDEG